MKTDLFAMVHNEETVIPHFVKFYKDRIFDINIHLYDNESTDDTVKVAKNLGCIVTPYKTGGWLKNSALMEFKDNVWKDSKADWIIVIDLDEWIDVDVFDLQNEKGDYFICTGYDMVGPPDTEYGVRNEMYDKVCVFRKSIKSISYGPGAHQAFIKSDKGPSKLRPALYHMRYPSKREYIARYQHLATRLSDEDKKNGWALQYLNDVKTLSDYYDLMDSRKTKIR